MARTPKKLAHALASTALAAAYTVPASTRTQVTEIWIENNDTQVTKNVTITAGRLVFKDSLANMINVPAKETVVISKTNIILTASETIGIYVDAAVTGTAQTGAATTITLAAGSSATDNYYTGSVIELTNDTPTGVIGLSKKITAYVGSTKVATVDSAWSTNPTGSTTYQIGPLYVTLFGIEESV